jgi:hypothetical protein
VMSRQHRPAVHAVVELEEFRTSTCDHAAPTHRQIESTHRTSEGTLAYARCACGAWLVLLDDQPLAATDPRRGAGSTAMPRSLGRGPTGRLPREQ